jgi:NAD(P)-dependent dehydrogenase (short-subunit alcohol dehydrogenase family)
VLPKRWDDVFAINVTANYRLIRSLDPLLKLSPAGRALFVSSGAAHNARPFWAPYSASKAALEVMVRSWAAEIEGFGVTANLMDPGATRTKMRAEAVPGEDPSTLPAPEEIVPAVVALLSPEEKRTGLIFNSRANAFTEAQRPRPV